MHECFITALNLVSCFTSWLFCHAGDHNMRSNGAITSAEKLNSGLKSFSMWRGRSSIQQTPSLNTSIWQKACFTSHRFLSLGSPMARRRAVMTTVPAASTESCDWLSKITVISFCFIFMLMYVYAAVRWFLTISLVLWARHSLWSYIKVALSHHVTLLAFYCSICSTMLNYSKPFIFLLLLHFVM